MNNKTKSIIFILLAVISIPIVSYLALFSFPSPFVTLIIPLIFWMFAIYYLTVNKKFWVSLLIWFITNLLLTIFGFILALLVVYLAEPDPHGIVRLILFLSLLIGTGTFFVLTLIVVLLKSHIYKLFNKK